jgi:SAM-dependent methyltransferase
MLTETGTLPKEMKLYTYQIMYQLENNHWWFVGRRKILSSFIEEALSGTSIKRGEASILDVGCGTGANLEMLAEFGKVEGIDISEEALSFCRARGLNRVKLGAAEKLPYEDGSFDLVTALDVVEHLDDDVAGLKEIHRVLRKGGRAVLFVPAFMFLWGVQDDISHHRRRYTLPQLSKALDNAGFKIKRASYANITFFAPILFGRFLMRVTGLKPESENNINIGALNNLFGKLFGAESLWLKRWNLPLGVSALCIAEKE